MWHDFCYSGSNGSLLTLVPFPLLLGNGVVLASLFEDELDFNDLEDDDAFLFVVLSGKICSLGSSSVPEFSAAK